jgi:hypothetical protein
MIALLSPGLPVWKVGNVRAGSVALEPDVDTTVTRDDAFTYHLGQMPCARSPLGQVRATTANETAAPWSTAHSTLTLKPYLAPALAQSVIHFSIILTPDACRALRSCSLMRACES